MVMIMKQFLLFILAGCIVLFSGCRSDISSTESLETEPSFLDASWQKATDSPESEETIAETKAANKERSDETTLPQSDSTETHSISEDKEQKSTTVPTNPKVNSTTPADTNPVTTPTAPTASQPETKPSTTTPSQPATEPAPSMPTQPDSEPTVPETTEPETKPTIPATTPTEPKPAEPTGCAHDWTCIHHDEVGHWKAGIVCDCGWTVYGDADELVAKWNAHSASYPAEEALFNHGGYGSADEWIVDEPAYDEWVCRLCGESKS